MTGPHPGQGGAAESGTDRSGMRSGTVWQIRTDADLVELRRVVRERSARSGMSLIEQTKFMTAASELARNTLVHGGGGQVEIIELRRAGTDAEERGVRLVFTDQGPGIADVAQAMTAGYTSGGGLGLGLGGARRLVEDFRLHTTPGSGTTVVIASWARAGRPSRGAALHTLHDSDQGGIGARW
ncbi:ATP-binding protein [Actinomadura terrae]|uniref:ATP-binding protein n=1 Tax=Actinomadura terrae TaxID=604353 RepID=UPI0027E20B41|nr:ATP-binding protein [Actinomadura terrae]